MNYSGCRLLDAVLLYALVSTVLSGGIPLESSDPRLENTQPQHALRYILQSSVICCDVQSAKFTEDCGQGQTKHGVPVSVAVVILYSGPLRCARHKLSVEDHCVIWPLACSGKAVVRRITQASISMLGGTRSICALLGQPVKLESTILPVSSVSLLLLAPGTHVKLDISAGGANSAK